MSRGKVNVLGVDLGARLDQAGFRHVATAIGPRLGAQRIGAGVYGAEAGVPIWPFHYHHGIEEWLYVIAGAPVLRELAGERVLAAGDLVCFPSGALGSHAVQGPGRFVIFATGQLVEPYLTVYPDSDKVSGPEGIFLRGAAVGYWHGEGTGSASEPAAGAREPATAPPPLPVANVLTESGGAAGFRPGPQLGGDRLDASVVVVAPGEAATPYRYVVGREEWVLVLSGALVLRRPDGEEPLEAGDLVCLAEGPAGAHQLGNRGASVAFLLVLSTTGLPVHEHHPETGDWLLRDGPGRAIVLHEVGAPRA